MTADEKNLGGGTGGGGDDDGPNIIKTAAGAYEISGNQVVLLTRPPLVPDKDYKPGPNVITILSIGHTLTDGKVDVRGSKGVRITAGPPFGPPTTSDSTDGVEIFVSDSQKITIRRGVMEEFAQKIELSPGEITMDAGLFGIVTIKAGPNSITVDGFKGITIKGQPFVNIN
jgi:hypothetical protein